MSRPKYPWDIPPVWMLLAVVAMFALRTWLPVHVWIDDPWRNLGWIPIATGFVLAANSLWLFRRAHTGVRPFSPVSRLVTTGVFRYTRNPMYLALVLIAFGIAVRLGTISALIVPPMLFVLLDRRFVQREEEFLRDRIGRSYDDYCARVRRWL